MSRTGAIGHSSVVEASPSCIRVVLLDRHTLVREGLRVLLGREPGIEVVAEAGSLRQALELDVAADVVVTELDLVDARGPELLGALRRQGLSILVVTLADHPAKVEEAVAAGAHGYLLKTATPDELALGVRTVARGDKYLQPSLGVELAYWHGATHLHGDRNGIGPGNGNGHDNERPRLSRREEQVVRLVALGHTNAEIGTLLAMSLRTVEAHRGRILNKLGCRTRAELVHYAHEAGLVAVG